MYLPRPTISLRQIVIAAAIAVVASFAVYFVFDVLPESFRSDDSGLTEAEIKSRLEKNLQNVSGDASAQTVDVNFDGYVISWQRTINEPSCEDPNSWYSRTVTIDLRNIETRPDRVRRYTREGRVMLIWKYDRDYEELLRRMNDKRDESLARIRSGGSSGANAAAQLSEVLTSEFGKELESGSIGYKYCSGENSIGPLQTVQFTYLTTPEVSEEIANLFDAYKMRVGAK